MTGEIISALQCVSGENIPCRGCPFLNIPFPTCKALAAKQALDLINRQRAEICDLKDENKGLKETNDHLSGEYIALMKEKDNLIRTYAECQTESIKEFAESMKKREGSNAYCCFCAHATIYGDRAKECDEPYIDKDGKEHSHCLMFSKFESYIDKFVKEMTEGE